MSIHPLPAHPLTRPSLQLHLGLLNLHAHPFIPFPLVLARCSSPQLDLVGRRQQHLQEAPVPLLNALQAHALATGEEATRSDPPWAALGPIRTPIYPEPPVPLLDALQAHALATGEEAALPLLPPPPATSPAAAGPHGSGSAADGSGSAADGPGLAAEGPGWAAGELEFRRVECAGRYDDARSLFVGPRAHTVRGAQEKGYFLVTPLVPPPGRYAHPSLSLAPSVNPSHCMPPLAHMVRGAHGEGRTGERVLSCHAAHPPLAVLPLTLPFPSAVPPSPHPPVPSSPRPLIPPSPHPPVPSSPRPLIPPSPHPPVPSSPRPLIPPSPHPPVPSSPRPLIPPSPHPLIPSSPPSPHPPHPLIPPIASFPFSPCSEQPAVLVNRGWVPEAVRREADTWMAGERAKGAAGEAGKEEVESGGSGTSRSGGGGSSSSGDVSEKGSTRGWFGSGGGTARASTGAGTALGKPNAPPVIHVSGVVRGSEKPNHFVPPNAPEHGEWFWVDVPAMAQACGLPRGTLLLDAMKPTEDEEDEKERTSDSNSSSSSGQAGVCPAFYSDPRFPRPKDPEELVKLPVMPTDHITYAATWFSLFTATSVMAYKRLRVVPKKRTLRICRHCKLKFVGGAFRCAQHITRWKGLKRKDVRLCKAPIPSADRGAVRELNEGKHAPREGKKKAEEMAIEACAGGAKKQCIEDFYGEGASCAKESADDAICLMWAALHLPEHLADHPL
ncbi:unnamed protein product [Closterium sp. NIES-64]|nr:unnamed protein product [Closterium sp. NIES-64]